MTAQISRDAIAQTHQRIRGHVRRTPVIEIDQRDLGLDGPQRLVLKLETLQHAGSFKVRGAFAHLVGRTVGPAGVTAASGGNHGAAVAFAAAKLGHRARIFVPEIAAPAKLAKIRALGAELVVAGAAYADAAEACRRYALESGALNIHAYDQPETLLGQGSLALELEAQAPNLDTVLVAVGGGGLIGGVAGYYEGRVKVIAVEPATSRALDAALEAGRPVDVDVAGVAADSLGARRVGDLMFPIARAFVENCFLVEDEAIRDAQRRLWDGLRLIAEPGGATALAALTSGVYRPSLDERVGVIVCGANTSPGSIAGD